MNGNKQPRVYIAAPATVDTAVLRRLLEAENTVVDDAFSIAAGEDVVSAVLTRIRKSDLVIAIMIEGGWTSYEVGVADALRKPVLLITSPGVFVPSQLARRQVLRSALADTEVLRLTLRKLLEDVRKNPRRLVSPKQKRPREPVANDLSVLISSIQASKSFTRPRKSI